MNIECCTKLREPVTAAIQNAFAPTVSDNNGGKVEKCIVSALFGSRKIRLNSYDDAQHQHMENLVSRYTAIGAPIEMLGMWGAVKAYGKNHDRCGMDVYDALAVHRLAGVAADVKRMYSPGMNVTIVCEDITEAIIGQCGDKLADLTASYSGTIARYAASNTDSIHFTTESALLHSMGKTPQDFLTLGEQMTDVLATYWKTSAQRPEDEWETLPEYAALRNVGWNGVIPSIMREHYINRVGSEYPESDTDFRIRIACRYLGNSLARYKIGMVASKTLDATGPIPTIKMGFGTHAPGAAKAFGRTDYKVKASKNSKTTTPPWCGWGVLETRDKGLEPTIIGVRTPDFTTEPVYVHSNGVCFRADVLQAA